jgi:pimeloyl-ACP methyl ester carboxylesterase
MIAALWSNITCPTLLVYGEESWAKPPAAGGRLDCFKNADVLAVPDAGHWVHHDRLDLFSREVRTFLAKPTA